MGHQAQVRDGLRIVTQWTEFVPGRISIVIATFNSARTLQQALDSVLGQSFVDKELIVIDGASTDGTVAIIERNAHAISSWVSEPDRGNYEAFNKGVMRSSGEWIYILGADDYLWSNDVLETMAAHLAAATSRVMYGQVAYVNDRGEVLQMLGQPWELARRHFRDLMTLPHQGVFHHRHLFEQHGLFDESFRMTGDYEFLLRELKTGRASFVPGVVVAGYRFGGGSSIPRNALKVLLEYRRGQRRNGIAGPRLYWLWLAARTAARMVIWQVLGNAKAARLDDWLRKRNGLPEIWTRV